MLDEMGRRLADEDGDEDEDGDGDGALLMSGGG